MNRGRGSTGWGRNGLERCCQHLSSHLRWSASNIANRDSMMITADRLHSCQPAPCHAGIRVDVNLPESSRCCGGWERATLKGENAPMVKAARALPGLSPQWSSRSNETLVRRRLTHHDRIRGAEVDEVAHDHHQLAEA